MDSGAFNHLGKALDVLFSWPVIAIFCCGLLSIVLVIGYALYWVISHLQWV